MNFLVSGSNGDIAISVINIISKEFPNSKIIATDSERPKKIFKNVKYLLFPNCRKKSYFQSLKNKSFYSNRGGRNNNLIK